MQFKTDIQPFNMQSNMLLSLLAVVIIAVILALVKPVPGDNSSDLGESSENLSNELKSIYDDLLPTLDYLKGTNNELPQPAWDTVPSDLGRQLLNSEITVDDKIKVMEAELLMALDNFNTSKSELAQAQGKIKELEKQINSTLEIAADKIKVLDNNLLVTLDNLKTSKSELTQAKETIVDLEKKFNSTLDNLKTSRNEQTQAKEKIADLEKIFNSTLEIAADKIKVLDNNLLVSLDNLKTSRSELTQEKETIIDLEKKFYSTLDNLKMSRSELTQAKEKIVDLEKKLTPQSSQQFAVNVTNKFDVAQGGESATVACVGSMGRNQSQCVSVTNVCYCLVTTQLSWVLANNFCITNNMSLLSIQTQSDQTVVSDTLMPLVLGVPISKQIGVWTSGSYNPELNTFAWSSTQKPFTFVNWFYGQPNTDNSTNQCVRIRIVPESLKDGKWATLTCEQLLPFICHK